VAAEQPVEPLSYSGSFMSGLIASVVSNVLLVAIFIAGAVILTFGMLGLH
jgi:hypothetical protein